MCEHLTILGSMSTYGLVIIDMQRAYFRNEALEAQREVLTSACNRLADAAHRSRHDVFMVTTRHESDRSTWTLNMLDDDEGYLLRDDTETELVAGLDSTGTIPIEKTRDSAFFMTELLGQLSDKAIDTIILAGVSTHSCVFMTAADAYAHGIRTMIVTDAIADHDPRYEQPALDILKQEYRQQLVTTDQVVGILA